MAKSTRMITKLDSARDIIFRAQAIVSVAAAASMSELPAHKHATEITLQYVADILREATDMLDTTALEANRDRVTVRHSI